MGGGFGGRLVGVVYYQIGMFWLLEALVIHLLDAVGFPRSQFTRAAVGEACFKVRREGDVLKLHPVPLQGRPAGMVAGTKGIGEDDERMRAFGNQLL